MPSVITRTRDRAAGGKPAAAPPGTRRRTPPAVWGVLLILPSLLLVAAVIAYPVAYLAQLSLLDAHPWLPGRDFVGLANYRNLLESTISFWPAAWLSTLYAVSTIALQTVLGVGIALLLHQRFRGRSLVRVLAILPYMIPTIVVALVWRWLLDPRSGAGSFLLGAVGLGDGVNWLGPNRVFASLVAVSVWTYTPFVMLSVLARLQTIDPGLWEAARVDGANAWQRFRHVTLPALRGVLLTLVLLRVMFMFTKFDVVYLFAGTVEQVRTLPVLTFVRIFGESRLGSGAAVAMLMFLLLLLFTTVYFRLSGVEREEER